MAKKIILKEKFEGGLKHALYSNFSKYTDAILELLDNSVSNRIVGRQLIIDVLVSKNELSIIDRGGCGMNIRLLKEFLSWGKIKKRKPHDIGAYSQGGKAAMGYLGKNMIITTSLKGENVQYKIEDDDLHDYRLKKYRVSEIPADFNEGRTHIEIGRLKRKIKEEVLKPIIIDTYRPLIAKEEIVIKYNGEILKISSFPIEEDFEKQNFSLCIGANKKVLSGWVGRLVPKSGIKGGMRCYKLGRLITEKEFFGPYDAHYKQTLNFLFGEVHLDHVPAITNKTDFDRDSQEWLNVKKKVFDFLKPHIDELLGREIREPTDEERSRIKQAQDIVAELMRMRNKEIKGNSIEGVAFGQKPSETQSEDKEKLKSIVGVRGKYQPKTPPPKDARGKRKRVREFMDWDLRPMDESVRSIIKEDDTVKVLVINNLFPGFKVAKGHLLYLIETAALQLAQPEEDEKITPQEYLKDFDDLYSFFCNNLKTVEEKFKKKINQKKDLQNIRRK